MTLHNKDDVVLVRAWKAGEASPPRLGIVMDVLRQVYSPVTTASSTSSRYDSTTREYTIIVYEVMFEFYDKYKAGDLFKVPSNNILKNFGKFDELDKALLEMGVQPEEIWKE